MPDFYQGTELWDFSLVDPDNRRPVDYALRAALLAKLPAPPSPEVRRLAESPADLRAKLHVIVRALELRRAHEDLYREGDYVPLRVRGARAAHVLAFARRRNGALAVSIAPRLYVRLLGSRDAAPIGGEIWGDTTIELPDRPAVARLTNLLDGRRLEPHERRSLSVGEVLAEFPVALLRGDA